jgi:hypothetical protein
MKIRFVTCLLVLSCCIKAQSLENIKARYTCDLKGAECEAVSASASIQLNLNDGDIVFRDNLGGLVFGKPSVDTLLDNYKNLMIVYEGSIQENVNDFMEGDMKDLMHVSGNLTLNGVSRPMTATCVPIRYNRSSNELYMNFNMVFRPSDFKLQPPGFPFTGDLQISIKNGFVNKIE